MEEDNSKEVIILFFIGITVSAAIFIGVTQLAKSAFKISSPQFQEIDSSNAMRKQRRYADDQRDRQRDFMRDQQQRIKDMQR